MSVDLTEFEIVIKQYQKKKNSIQKLYPKQKNQWPTIIVNRILFRKMFLKHNSVSGARSKHANVERECFQTHFFCKSGLFF